VVFLTNVNLAAELEKPGVPKKIRDEFRLLGYLLQKTANLRVANLGNTLLKKIARWLF
jgi:hypothetical protein